MHRFMRDPGTISTGCKELREWFGIDLMNDEQIWQLLEFMPDAVIVVRAAGTIAFANRQAARLLGYMPHELIGHSIEMLVPERFRDRHAKRSKAYLGRPVVRPMGAGLDLDVLCRDGHEVPVDISLSPIETASELLVVASIRDISDRRNTELDLRKAVAELERLRNRLKGENLYLREQVDRAYGFGEFVGQSDLLRLLIEKIDQVATTEANVLILGETGTGKELVARAIHNRSGRRDRPLVKVNCAALPASLIESELFGHEAGAFTGALTRRIGYFELAEAGTIFLDEVGELPVDVQSKLLRVIQDGVFSRVGSSTTKQADVRVIAATNRDLHGAMQQGRFRHDLYFRMAVFPIEVPSLRARREDIPLLVWHFVSKIQPKLGKRIEEISPETMNRLAEYPWPGNIRELQNVIERAIILSSGSALIVEQLLDVLDTDTRFSEAKSGSIDHVVREHILSVLEECHWRIKGAGAAADRLGMNPSTLRYRMKKLRIKRP